MVGGGVGRPPPAPLNWGSTTSCTQLTPHSAGGLRQLEEGGPRPPGIQPGRAPATVPGDGPGRRGPAVRIRLLDMARRWLRPELRSADGVVELVTLERFIDGLPGETANWVRCHRPTGLAAAVTLAEDHMALYPAASHSSSSSSSSKDGQTRLRAGEPFLVPFLPPFLPPFPVPKPPHFPATTLFFLFPQPQAQWRRGSTQRAPQSPGPGCWRCGQPGHLRRECPLMEVGQVVRVVGPPTSTPDPDGAYCIPTDASDRGLGAVLTQQVEGVDLPVLYISRKLSQREAKHSTVEKECLAIRWAVGALRYYLLGRPFTLCSDHAPLQWLHRMKDTNARITRWYLALQPFNFKVI
ncbi:hypothetical protein ANANG_G00121600, partial [Anguilla anguilla]